MAKFNSNLIDRNYVYKELDDEPDSTPHFVKRDRRVIVCLCGSTRFWEQFQETNYRETMAGRIVLSVGFYPHSSQLVHGQSLGCDDAQKKALDELHLEKIYLADEVVVLNVDGYVGESTWREVLNAERHGKTIRWLEPFSVPPGLAHIGDSLSDGPKVHRDSDNDPDNVEA